MPTVPIHALLGHLHRLTDPPAVLPDGVLVRQFVERRDEEAFTTLVRRHGPMVLGVCRSLLRQEQDAEDAFQATFLVLARKAAAIRKPDSVASWLHGVARGLARNLQARARCRRGHERRVSPMPPADPLLDLTVRELQCAVSEELDRLPEQYRTALVLCSLEGKTPEDAARVLGCSAGALRGRLHRGRSALRRRLARRGIALSAAFLAGTVPGGAAPLTGPRVDTTVRAALRYAADGLVSSPAAALAEAMVKGVVSTRLLAVGTLLLGLSLLGVGAATLAPRTPPADREPTGAPAPVAGRDPRTDADGEPLPRDAVARLGTTRFRNGGLVDSLAFTPDGKTLLCCGPFDGVRAFDAATGKEIRWSSGRPKARGMALSPDGKRLATVGGSGNPQDPSVRVYDFASGRLLRTFGKPMNFNAVRFSPDGKVLAVFGWDPVIELWDPDAGQLLRTLKGHNDIVWSAVFSRDGKSLISASDDKTIRSWDVATGHQQRQITHTERVGKLARSPDGRLLASVDVTKQEFGGGASWRPDHRVRLWDVATGKEVRQLAIPAREVSPGVQCGFLSLGFAPDGRMLLAGEIVTGTLHVWDPATGQALRRLTDFAGTVSSLGFSPDGKSVAVGHGNSAVRVLNLATGTDRVGGHGHGSYVSSVAVTPDGRSVVTTSGDGTLRFWDPATGHERNRRAFAADPTSVSQVLPDRKSYLTVGRDGVARIRDLATGQERCSFRCDDPYHFALSPDQQTFAAWGSDQTVRLFDVATGRPRHALLKVEGDGPGMAFAADGKVLVVWGPDRSVTVWDTATARRLHWFTGPSGEGPVPIGGGSIPYSAALSPDGKLLAFGLQVLTGKAGALPILETSTGREVCRFTTAEDGASQMAFSPDGRVLAWTGWRDGTVHLGEIATGGERRQFTGHRGRVYTLGFAADGKTLVSGGEDTTAMVWDLTGRLAGHEAWGRRLSDEELNGLWTTLAGTDAAAGYRAVQALAADPAHSVPFLSQRIRPVAAVPEERLRRLLADLDSDRFGVRDRAMGELERLGEGALPALRKALDARPPLETRRRLEHLIGRQERLRWSPSPERLRLLRALEALERTDGPAARYLLEALAGGAPGAWLTEEAKAALARCTGSAVPPT